MNKRSIISWLFIATALVLGVIFLLKIDFPVGLEPYFQKTYYGQFGPLAISIELLLAGFYLYRKHPKTNFALALFGFTALLDPLFNFAGFFVSNMPIYGTVIFSACAIVALWIALSNSFSLKKISLVTVFVSFVLGVIVELFFNYL
ncbi:MAG: hypothetical protein HEP71_26770 [Roseivirga sp.]|nr:hypothetical protein [Roseivirga sp.]